MTISDISWEHHGISAEVDWMATARGRVGFLIHPNYLAYATAGLGIAHVEVSDDWFGESIADTGTDFVFGVGVEGQLTGTSTLRVEYLGFDDLDIIRAGLNFRLNGY